MPDGLEVVAVIGVVLAWFVGVTNQVFGLRKMHLEMRKLRRDLEEVQPRANSSPHQAQRAGPPSPIREKLAVLVLLAVFAGAMFYFGASSSAISGFEVLAVVMSASSFLLVFTGYTIAKMASGLLNLSTDILSVLRELVDSMGSLLGVEEELPSTKPME